MTMLTIHDRERDLLALDQMRRFVFLRKTVAGWVGDRLLETRKHRDELRERVYAAFSKADVPRDKAEGVLAKLDAFGVDMDDTLRAVYEDFIVGRALEFVIDELDRFGALLVDPSCIIGTALAAYQTDGGVVALSSSEVAFLRKEFDAKRFHETIAPSRPVPLQYGVATAARRIAPFVGNAGIGAEYPGVPTIGLADLAKIG